METKVLNLGLGFVPTPQVDFFNLHCELQALFRKIRLNVHFSKKPFQSESNTGLRIKSTFMPPDSETPPELITFERSVLSDLKDLSIPKTFHNLSKEERSAITILDKDPTIVIKPADKGGGIVILPKQMYRQECQRLLDDRASYLPLSQDPTKRLLGMIRSLVFEAESLGWILPTEAAFLINTNPQVPYFYILPKIHKGVIPPPGRPIVSGINSVLEPLSKFTDYFLRPLVSATPTYLKDTKDVLNLITHLNCTHSIDLLMTLDVESLYTSIPQEATLEVIETVLHKSEWRSRTPIHFVMDCASLALKENYFQFEEQLYLQVKGTSMGSTFAPSLACLYMSDFEERFILHDSNPFINEICTWKRYIDDILIIWQGDLEKTTDFLTWINSLDPYLKFTQHVSVNELPFLDLLITIREGKLETRTFFKPTDKNSLLKYESHHPKALRDNLPYGQFLRLRRNCSENAIYQTQSEDLMKKLKIKGYPSRMVKQAQKRALSTPREVLLETKTQTTKENLTCVTTFSPISNQVRKIILKRWNILNSNTLKIPRPLFSFKKTQSIRDLLIHTRPMTQKTSENTTISLPPVTGHFPCGSCSVCKFTKPTKTLQLPDGTTWVQKTHTNCNTAMCVYMISCPCNKYYVGMTSRQIKTRIGEHRSTIRRGRSSTRLTNHYIELHHSPDDLSWTVLETVNKESLLFVKEQRWVFRLGTSTSGLNDAIPWSTLNK